MTDRKELINQAAEAAKNSYSPYSHFPVGACVLYESGKTYSGCNIENSSYGLTLCAERNAISTAIAQGEKSRIKKIAVVSPKRTRCYPCGACLQWLQEFEKGQNITVILEDENFEPIEYELKNMLPNTFKFDII